MKMTIKIKLLMLLFCVLIDNADAQIIVGGVKVPGQMKQGSTVLNLNGAGIREKYFMDMYVGALYLNAKSNNGEQICRSDEAMAIRLHIVSSLISSDKMNEAVDEGFKKSAGNQLNSLQTRINQFKAAFNEEIKKGDVFEIFYEPGKGVQVVKNGKTSVVIAGLDFKRALFGIWLGAQPADDDLKAGMLGT